MLVKQDGIDLHDTTQNAGSNRIESCVISEHLFTALHGTAEFWSGDHTLLMVEGRDYIHRRHTEVAETGLGESWAAASTEDARWMVRITRT